MFICTFAALSFWVIEQIVLVLGTRQRGLALDEDKKRSDVHTTTRNFKKFKPYNEMVGQEAEAKNFKYYQTN